VEGPEVAENAGSDAGRDPGSADAEGLLHVEVAYAEPHDQRIVPLKVAPGTTALEAAQQSRVQEHFPNLVLDEGSRLGIFGHIVPPTQVLQEGDRVEIYRPLLADPKEVRKERAARARARRG
jgi:putative ubiquitin-RnfH superfamily antitoxin RatB of RatAB toxin-antitoxin module